MEPNGRQMLLTNAVQTSWPANRQMAIVPSWQQLSAHQGAIQQPLLSDAGDWGRGLIVDSSALLQVRFLTSETKYLILVCICFIHICLFTFRISDLCSLLM